MTHSYQELRTWTLQGSLCPMEHKEIRFCYDIATKVEKGSEDAPSISKSQCPTLTGTRNHSYLQSWPKLCGISLQNALPRPSISFSHGNKCSLGQILPSPLPPSNVVRKERLAEESSNIASGGKGGASEYCSNSGKRHSVPHILARIVGQPS